MPKVTKVVVVCGRLNYSGVTYQKGNVLTMSEVDAFVAVREKDVVPAPDDAPLSQGTRPEGGSQSGPAPRR